MTHRMAFEALDRTLHDLVVTPSSLYSSPLFSGKVIVLGGNLRLKVHLDPVWVLKD
jgi:hypothetical protein